MNALNTFLQSPLPRFADSISEIDVPSGRLRSRSLIALLLILCFVPRAVLACLLKSACSDGYYYIAVADALDRGEFAAAFSYLNLNVYPAALLFLHRAGLEWFLAAKLWGVVLGTLTILPLFGWVRRMFDDRIAAIACLLYAIHPEIIEISVEPIRETTFWFFAMLAMYLMLRAVTENKIWLFASAGAISTLAVHTRSEGWLLVLTVLAWTAFRIWQQKQSRLKLAAGLAVCLAMFPAMLFATNVTLLRHHTQWEWARLEIIRTAYRRAVPAAALVFPVAESSPLTAKSSERIETSPVLPPQPSAVPTPPVAPSIDGPIVQRGSRIDMGQALFKYFDALIASYEPLALFLTLVGMFVVRRVLLQCDKLLLWAVTPAIFGAVWLRLLAVGSMNGRYFLVVFFLLVPFTAIGQLVLLRWLGAIVSRFGGLATARRLSPAVFLSLIVCGCWGDALKFEHAHRTNEAVLGRWLRDRVGPVQCALVDKESGTVGYYAQNDYAHMLIAGEAAEDAVRTQRPNLLIIDANQYTSWSLEYRNVLAAACASQGLERMPIDESLRAHDRFVVFAEPKRQPRDETNPPPPVISSVHAATRE